MIVLLQGDPSWFTTLLPQFPLLAVAIGTSILARKAYKEDLAEIRKEHRDEMAELRREHRHTINVILTVFEAALAKDDPVDARELVREVRASIGEEDARKGV